MNNEKSETVKVVDRLTEALADVSATLQAIGDALWDRLLHETYTEQQFYAERQQFPSPDWIEGGWYEYAYPLTLN